MSSPRPSSRTAREDTEIPTESRSIEETVRSLRKLLEGDEEEQRETFSVLKKALDEDRSSGRKLFSTS
jgi:hypothetical protein